MLDSPSPQRLPDRILGRLSRRTTSGRFIPEVDGLRFVSIVLVVLFHLSGHVAERAPAVFTEPPPTTWLFRLFAHGDNGVELFFIVSGFVLGLPFALAYLANGRPVPLGAYFWRRVTRLEPPYVVSMFGFYVLRVLVVGMSATALFPHLVASLLYVHNLAFGAGSAINYVAWSLEIEVQFYILAPVIAAGLYRIRRAVPRRLVVAAISLAAIALQQALIVPETRPALSILNFIQFFLLGFLLADLYVTSWGERPRLGRAWDVIWLAGWPALIAIWSRADLEPWLFPPLAFLLFVAAFRGPVARAMVSNRWVATVGGMCYTIYLLHFPLISFVGRVADRLTVSGSFAATFLLQALVQLPVIVLVSAAFFILVERPCMDREWPGKLTRWARARLARGSEPALR